MSKKHPKQPLVLYGAVILITALATTYLYISKATSPVEQSEPNREVIRFLNDNNSDQFLEVTQIRPFNFPKDHGPHPEYRNEWWYFTGNLSDQRGRKFGFQLTFFRSGIKQSKHVSTESAWRTDQIYMAHFALTDVHNQKHYAFERFSRGAVDLAGAQSIPFRVWLENWSVEAQSMEKLFPLKLQASTYDDENQLLTINLGLDTMKPIVLQGDKGFSRKSTEPGNASYYYSFTRLPTQGTITIGEKTFKVQGSSWLDREWSTSTLSKEQAGWDWFSLQLDDQREIMFFQIRLKNGGIDSVSQGVLVNPDGSYQTITMDDIKYKYTSEWTSPKGNRYPTQWHMQLPKHGIDIHILPLMADQEMRLSFTYWEGAVQVSGSHQGVGYIELTGY